EQGPHLALGDGAAADHDAAPAGDLQGQGEGERHGQPPASRGTPPSPPAAPSSEATRRTMAASRGGSGHVGFVMPSASAASAHTGPTHTRPEERRVGKATPPSA